jgi:hypothetical protein
LAQLGISSVLSAALVRRPDFNAPATILNSTGNFSFSGSANPLILQQGLLLPKDIDAGHN